MGCSVLVLLPADLKLNPQCPDKKHLHRIKFTALPPTDKHSWCLEMGVMGLERDSQWHAIYGYQLGTSSN